MIVGGGGGSTVAAFPDPPTGSPGDLAGVARSLRSAGDDLEQVESGLRSASATLAGDWRGYAAAAYHSCSEGLAAVARGGVESFHECAQAVSGYAAALDHAQSEIRRLRALYDAALSAQAAAGSAASGLQVKLAGAKPSETSSLTGQIQRADAAAQDAATSAASYARQATIVLNEFHQAESRYAGVLDGTTLSPGGRPAPGGPWIPFASAGAAGPGFGTPFSAGASVPGLLASTYGGVIGVGDPWNSPIPGYGTYMDATHGNATSPGDLTDLITFLAPLAGAPLKLLGEEGLRALAAMGIGAAGRAATEASAQAAAREAVQQLLDSGAARGSTSLSKLLPGAVRDARLTAVAKAQVAQAEARAKAADPVLEILDHQGLLPPGVKMAVSEALHRGTIYTGYAVAQLVAARGALAKVGTPAARALGRAVDVILGWGR